MHLLKLLLLAAALSAGGCMHLDVRLASFMTPDRGTRSVVLPEGYVIENRILSHEGREIGITHARHPANRATILFCGGDAFHRSIEGGEVARALALNADVVLFDYPGYGDSSGSPGTDAILETAVAVYDHIFGPEHAAAKVRVIYGFSLGGMVAAHLAQERRADGLVLEASPPTVRDWARTRIPQALKPFVKIRIEPQLAGIDAVAALEHFRGEVLLLTSRADEMVPAKLAFAMKGRLEQAHRDVTLIEFPNRGHGTIAHSPAFPATLRGFLEQVSPLP